MALTKITGQVINDSTGLVVGVTTVGGGLSATDGFFSGIVTAVGDASFSGNVSVGGTLTYEDVTNIDAVGLVTARNGIVVGSGITLSKDGDGFFTGVVTATSYAGDGSGLTGIAATDNVRTGILDVAGVGTFRNDVNISDKIIHLGDTDTAIRFSDADTITAETGGSSRFKIDSSGNVTIGNDGDSGSNPSSGYDELCIEGGNEAIGMCFLSPAANDVEQTIAFGDSNNNQSGKIQYEHANDAMHFDTAGTERARIESAGNVKIEKNLNVVGVCTATSFSGSGANLTGIAGIPTGVIVLWSGAANAIPTGYVLCDGNNSTPDLRDRFVVGAGNNYSVADTGGADSVTLTIDQIPSHNHSVNRMAYTGSQHGFRQNGANQGGSTTGSTGGGQAHENRPPYYALCYIMKT